MRKIVILGACILAATAASAQQTVIKDAERALKEGKTAEEVVAIVTPAFTDPETATLAQTWYIPGKAAYSQYDNLIGVKALGKLPEGGEVLMGNLLIDGYGYFTKALPFDSLPNEKGKVKPKYSKEIHNTIAGHYTDYNNAAIAFWEAKDYGKAYEAWELFCTIPGKVNVNAPADTTMGEIRYNQALAAWQNENYEAALASFLKAKDLGYTKKNLYDYAIAVATQAKKEDAVYDLAKEAKGLYGKEDPNYVGYMINRYLQNKEFDKAYAIIDEAIADDPDNAQYYVVKGILLSENEKKGEAKDFFKKAIALDAANSMALYQYGRALCEEAYALGDTAPTSPKESEIFFEEKIKPLFLEAADYLERAYDEDNNNTDALRYLENAYYNLRDEQKLQDVQNRLK
ncbi:MAG: hypothetical protein K2L99_05500 [Muribaculaceae bacterium]|nr:hypothetical protein [Muribaculaceae bacterium]